MSVDIYHSRRGHFRYCQYWNRDENDQVGDLTKWMLERKPSGSFYATESSPKTNQADQLSNVFLFDKNVITLVTNDNVKDIKRGSVVQYLYHAWLVQNVQFELHHKESEYATEEYTTYISLTR